MLVELKQCFMEAYDDNQDGKIDIRELAQLLPMEENFLLLFRFDNPLESSVEFMKVNINLLHSIRIKTHTGDNQSGTDTINVFIYRGCILNPLVRQCRTQSDPD